jgi:hypothetical protein
MKSRPVDSLAKQLAILLEGAPLPASSMSQKNRLRIQSLFDAGIIEEVRSGAGRCLTVTNQAALQTYIHSLYPSGLAGFSGDLPAKSKAVAERRDSKKAVGKRTTILQIRGFNDFAFYKDDSVLPVAEWSKSAGVAAICLDWMKGWKCRGPVGLVENLETFWHLEKIAPLVDLAIYAEGRIGANILDWLNSPEMVAVEVVHFPDYDPVGMDEYLRIKRSCPGRANLFLPAELEKLFSRYGKAQLLHDSSVILARLRKNSDSEVLFVVELMDRFGVGLEQEGLLIDPEL